MTAISKIHYLCLMPLLAAILLAPTVTSAWAWKYNDIESIVITDNFIILCNVDTQEYSEFDNTGCMIYKFNNEDVVDSLQLINSICDCRILSSLPFEIDIDAKQIEYNNNDNYIDNGIVQKSIVKSSNVLSSDYNEYDTQSSIQSVQQTTNDDYQRVSIFQSNNGEDSFVIYSTP